MAIPLTGAQGLFTRLGKIGGLFAASNLFRGNGALIVSSLVGTAGTVTGTTVRSHGYTTNDTINIAGATGTGAAYNGAQTVTVTGNTTFTFPNATNTTATGFITATKTGGVGFYSVGPYFDNIFKQFTTTDLNQVNTLYSTRDSFRSVFASNQQAMVQLAQSIVIAMANDDTPQPDGTLTTALKYLINQMTGSNSVTKPTVTITPATGGSDTGNGTGVGSVLAASGLQNDYQFTEVITATCQTDAQSGGTAGQETFLLTSPVAQPDETDWTYVISGAGASVGSGLALSLTTVDWTQNNSGGNVLQNSNFATFTTANVADNWTIAVGTAGTTVFQGGSGYRGSSSMQFTGNGSELTAVTQSFNTTPGTGVGAGGTSFALLPDTVYQVFLVDKVSVVPAAGVLQIALTNASGTVINDNQGTANSFTVSLPGETTSFAVHTATFRTPSVLPTATPLKLQAKLTTALSSGSNVLFQLGMTPAVQLYAGGPFASIFRGSTDWIGTGSGGSGDTITFTVSNNYSSQWALLLEPLFSLRSLGLAIPSSASPTIADSLING